MELFKPPDPIPASHKIPDRLPQADVASAIALRLGGAPADGSAQRVGSAPAPRHVIWIDRGDEVLVYLDSVRTQIVGGMLLVSIDLETDQTGRASLIVALALGGADDPAGLVAVTDDLPRGNGLLASRWGRILQDAVWGSLTGLAADHAGERGLAPQSIALVGDALQLRAAAPVAAIVTARDETGR
jgi:hypothetical protein